MSYQFDFENPDAASYDRRAHPSSGATGGIVSAGSFGMDKPAPEPIYSTVVRKVNPNFVLGGCIAVGGLWMLSSLISALGTANPNNQMLETSTVQAEAYKVMIESQSKAMQAVANQRPACIALVCNTSEPSQSQPQYQPENEPFQAVQQPPIVEESLSSPSPSPTPVRAVPTDAKTVAFGVHHMGDQPYIDEWHRFCAPNWDVQSECQALRVALTNQFANQ